MAEFTYTFSGVNEYGDATGEKIKLIENTEDAMDGISINETVGIKIGNDNFGDFVLTKIEAPDPSERTKEF